MAAIGDGINTVRLGFTTVTRFIQGCVITPIRVQPTTPTLPATIIRTIRTALTPLTTTHTVIERTTGRIVHRA